jgi:hypothetical protein
MLINSRVRFLVVPIAMALFMLAGCSRRTITVSGAAVLPTGVKVGSTDSVQIMFLPEAKEEKKVPTAAFSPADSSFVCNDILPNAKYKIAVRIDPGPGVGDMQKRAASFETVNKTFDRASTKLAYQAGEDATQSITIDFAKGTVTKK